MRKLFYILASILFTFSTNAEEDKWEWMGLVHNPVPGYAYNKVFAIGKDTVFLVGEQGVVLRSLNGLLESWDIQSLPDKPKLTGIHFRNAHEGYLVGGKRIYRTQDGGENWSSVYEDGTETLSAVCCVGTNTVWTVGTNGRILKSKDNGETPYIHYGDSVTGYLTQHGIVIRTVPEGYIIPNSIIESNHRDLKYKIMDGTLTIINSKYDIDQLTIVDLLGQSQFSKKVKGQQTGINLSGLNSGVYIVRLNYENNRSYSFKISVL